MIGKSIKGQLIIISLLFFVFVTVVLFQMYYAQLLQKDEAKELVKGHELINRYLALEDEEKVFVDELKAYTKGRSRIVPETIFKEISAQINTWFSNVTAWEKVLRDWEKGKKSFFSKNFLDRKERQAKDYGKILSMCREDRFDEAGKMINIEVAFQPSVHESVLAILDGIKIQLKKDRNTDQRFYIGTVFAVLLALIALVLVSVGIFRNITGSLKLLEDGARRVSNGDFEQEIVIKSPVELSSLSKTFNDMQETIKMRDETIRKDSDEIRGLNEVLEKKVVDKSRTILNKNIALERKNKELEQILYAASHDLRTPLISIQGFSEELKTTCNNVREITKGKGLDDEKLDQLFDEEISIALNYIINGSNRMEVLLEGLLRLSRMGRDSLQVKEVNMMELVKNVVDAQSFQFNEADAGIDITQLDNCRGDSSLLEQVFTNLIGNAVKYRAPDKKCSIKIYSDKKDGFVRYFVEDNGVGIADENKDRVFHAFFRVENDSSIDGDGVGLAIVNRAVDLHNGRTWIEKSEPGEGSTFAFEIPEENTE